MNGIYIGEIPADIYWLACKEECSAGNLVASIRLTELKQKHENIPQKYPGWKFCAEDNGKGVVFLIEYPENLKNKIINAEIFPYENGILNASREQTMMKKVIIYITFLLLSASVFAQNVEIGNPAPLFDLKDSNSKIHSLEKDKGEYVVLEWINFECPFVKKHYNSGNMQKLQEKYIAKGAAWYLVCSSAEGKQGYFPREEINERLSQNNFKGTAYLIDREGKVGKSYGAKTTPHIFIIDPDGVLIYAGEIDDNLSANIGDIENAINCVELVLKEAFAGKDISIKTTKSYGCSVKY